MKRAVMIVLAVLIAFAFAQGLAHADGPNRAGIVVSYENVTEATCIEFDEPEITGAELLSRSGLAVVSEGSGLGTAVCSIDGVGCNDPNDCWCQCHGATCRYWAYFTLEGGQWTYSAVGAARRKVHDGDLDGWTWGLGVAGAAAPPDTMTFEDVCPEEEGPATIAPPLPTATEAPPTAQVVETPVETPSPAATVFMSTPIARQTPTAAMGGEPHAEEDADSGFPWQLPAFAGVAAGMLGTAVVLARRRSRG